MAPDNSATANLNTLSILLIEDNMTDRELVTEMLQQSSAKDSESPTYEIHHARSLAAAEPFWKLKHDLVLLDLSLPDSRGMATFMRVEAQAGDAPIVVLSGLDDYQLALDAVRNGAQDYLVKWQMDYRTFSRVLRFAIERQKGEIEIRRNRSEVHESPKKVHLKEKLTTVGQLATSIVHELNNPLSLILGYTQSLIRHPDPVELLHTLSSIEREAIRCRTLVQRLLVFSRYRQGDMSLKDPREVVESALALVESQAHTQNVKLEKIIGESLPSVKVDTDQIEQALINLCRNAIDAMPQGGTLSVGLNSSPNEVQIRVRDSGDGIPENIREHIFEPFFTTKEPGRGTGLGLSIVTEIVERHQGRLEVESAEGKGSTFILRLPAATVNS